MSLQNIVSSLTKTSQHSLAIKLLEIGSQIWNDFAEVDENLKYIDSVVGMNHIVSADIISRTLNTATRELEIQGSMIKDLKRLKTEFSDPIVSLQDLDWEIPDPVESIFYSAYNIIESMIGSKDTYDGRSKAYISINQSIDAITKKEIKTFDEINQLLNNYLE